MARARERKTPVFWILGVVALTVVFGAVSSHFAFARIKDKAILESCSIMLHSVDEALKYVQEVTQSELTEPLAYAVSTSLDMGRPHVHVLFSVADTTKTKMAKAETDTANLFAWQAREESTKEEVQTLAASLKAFRDALVQATAAGKFSIDPLVKWAAVYGDLSSTK